MTPQLAYLGHLLVAAIMLNYGIRGRRGRLSPRGPGIRTPDTLASREAFDTANRVASPWMIAAAAPWFISATILFASGGASYRPLTIAAIAAMVVFAAIGYISGARAARAVRDDTDPR